MILVSIKFFHKRKIHLNLKYIILVIGFLSHSFLFNLYAQEDRFHLCLNKPVVFSTKTDSQAIFIDSVLSDEIGDSYFLRFLESCNENTSEYGLQVECDFKNRCILKSFRFSFDVWYALNQESKDLSGLKLLLRTDTVDIKSIEPLMNIFNILFSKQTDVTPISPGGSCYEFYLNTGDTIKCGLVRDPIGPTKILIDLMDKMSDFSLDISEKEMTNQLNNVLFQLENNYLDLRGFKFRD